MSTRCRGRNGSSGRGGLKRRHLRPTRASRTPMAAALTRPPDARRWPTRAALWAAIVRVMQGFRQRRWLRMRMAPCSATDGGRARGGSRIWIRLRRLAKRRRGARFAGWGRAGFPHSGFRLSLRRRWRGRSSGQSSRRLPATRSGAGRRFWPESWANRLPRQA